MYSLLLLLLHAWFVSRRMHTHKVIVSRSVGSLWMDGGKRKHFLIFRQAFYALPLLSCSADSLVIIVFLADWWWLLPDLLSAPTGCTIRYRYIEDELHSCCYVCNTRRSSKTHEMMMLIELAKMMMMTYILLSLIIIGHSRWDTTYFIDRAQRKTNLAAGAAVKMMMMMMMGYAVDWAGKTKTTTTTIEKRKSSTRISRRNDGGTFRLNLFKSLKEEKRRKKLLRFAVG